MKAATYTRYGTPDVVRITECPRPTPKPDEILIEVHAAGVNTGDWRLRAAAFPGLLMAVAGRLMFGITGPRKPVLGSEFAGRVAAIGASVTDFAPGDRVFGFSGGGAHAQYLTIKASGAVAHLPDTLSFTDAAALPFGAATAQEFLHRFAALKPGERVLIVGASGGVGAYAVQIAKALGAEVTAVASAGRANLLRDLGADHVIDYRATDPATLTGPFDVVFDTVGVLGYDDCAAMLARGGRFVPLNFGPADMRATRRAKRAGHKIVLKVNGDTKDDLLALLGLIKAGRLRPVIDTILPFDQIHEAYRLVESRHRAGAVVLDLAPQAGLALAAQ
jgi:NADPH:quinone reductase-like Zn-dependent oxidoreductase